MRSASGCDLNHSKSNDVKTLANSLNSACCRWYAKVPPQEFKLFIQEIFHYLAKPIRHGFL